MGTLKGTPLMGRLEGLTLPAHKINDMILYTCLGCEAQHAGLVEKAVFLNGEWHYSVRCKESPGVVQGHPESVVTAAEKTLYEVEVGNGVGVRVRKCLEDGNPVHRTFLFDGPGKKTQIFEGDPDSCIKLAEALVEWFKKGSAAPFMSPT